MGATPLIPQVFVICGVGALAGLTYSCFHATLVIKPVLNPPSISNSADTSSQPADTRTQPTEAALGLEISIPQAKTLFDAGATFIDARHRDEYNTGHVAGAFHMTADMLTGGKTPDVLNFLDPAQPVVIYCGGGACDASHNVAALLQQLGFTQFHIMHDGYPGWLNAGHAISTENPLGSIMPLPAGGANG